MATKPLSVEAFNECVIGFHESLAEGKYVEAFQCLQKVEPKQGRGKRSARETKSSPVDDETLPRELQAEVCGIAKWLLWFPYNGDYLIRSASL